MLGGVALYVGTSGFDYPEWRAPRDNPGEPHFYPPGVARSRFLAHYSGTFTACEINATFYRLESPATVARWVAAVPDAFRFATKAHRRLTHGRQISLDGPRARFLERF